MYAKKIFFKVADILGILVSERSGKLYDNDNIVEQLIEIIINIRQKVRKSKEWSVADNIRDSLGNIGIILEDSPQGVRWKRR